GVDEIAHFNLVSDVFLAGRLIFLQSTATLDNLVTYTTLAVKIPTIFSSTTNTKFRYWESFRTNRAMLYVGGQCYLSFHTPLRYPSDMTVISLVTTLHLAPVPELPAWRLVFRVIVWRRGPNRGRSPGLPCAAK